MYTVALCFTYCYLTGTHVTGCVDGGEVRGHDCIDDHFVGLALAMGFIHDPHQVVILFLLVSESVNAWDKIDLQACRTNSLPVLSACSDDLRS